MESCTQERQTVPLSCNADGRACDSRVVRGSNFVQPNPTQPNPYQSENVDPGPNPTHNPTDPIKTTTNLLVQGRQLSAHDVTFARFAYLRHGNQCPLHWWLRWIQRIIKIFNFCVSAVLDPWPNPTHQKSKNLDPTQPNPTRGLTQPMDNSVWFVTAHWVITFDPSLAQYNTVQYDTIRYDTIQYNTI